MFDLVIWKVVAAQLVDVLVRLKDDISAAQLKYDGRDKNKVQLVLLIFTTDSS